MSLFATSLCLKRGHFYHLEQESADTMKTLPKVLLVADGVAAIALSTLGTLLICMVGGTGAIIGGIGCLYFSAALIVLDGVPFLRWEKEKRAPLREAETKRAEERLTNLKRQCDSSLKRLQKTEEMIWNKGATKQGLEKLLQRCHDARNRCNRIEAEIAKEKRALTTLREQTAAHQTTKRELESMRGEVEGLRKEKALSVLTLKENSQAIAEAEGRFAALQESISNEAQREQRLHTEVSKTAQRVRSLRREEVELQERLAKDKRYKLHLEGTLIPLLERHVNQLKARKSQSATYKLQGALRALQNRYAELKQQLSVEQNKVRILENQLNPPIAGGDTFDATQHLLI